MSDRDDQVPERPRTRADCVTGPRPCPWYGCRHHLGVEVSCSGSVTAADLGEMRETCALDVADRGPHTLEQLGTLLVAQGGDLGLSKERVRQLEAQAIEAFRQGLDREGLSLADILDVATGVGDQPRGGRRRCAPLKPRLLAALRRGGWHSARELAGALGERKRSVRSSLTECWRAGEITRVRQGKEFVYAAAGTPPPPTASTPPAPSPLCGVAQEVTRG